MSCDAGSSSDDDPETGAGGTSAAGAATVGGRPANAGAPAAGASNVAGSASAGGRGGSGGGGSALAGGPFPFPQNKASGACTITTNAAASSAVQAAYSSWKTAFVASAGSGLRVRRPTDGDDTVSEGIAYGMLIAVYMVDRPLFDGLWAYAQSHFTANGLMNWRITAGNQVAPNGMGSASDADEDMAWALIMASGQWSSAKYLEEAKTMISAMRLHLIAPDGMLKPGDNWGGSSTTYPDYFSPAYFRVFAEVTGDANWSGAILNRNYEILDAVSGQYGLVPDISNAEHQPMGNYGYDACRTPWRIAMDYCFNGEPRAKAYLDKVAPFFNGIGASNIGDGYSLTGQKTSDNKNMAFIGPAGVSGMAGYQQLLDAAFGFGASGTGGGDQYYPQSLRVVTMLMMSGNFLDYTKP